MKIRLKRIILFFTLIFCINLYTTKVEADVGSFESYDSGGSSWSSSDSWSSSSSSWGDSWDSSSSHRSYSSNSSGTPIFIFSRIGPAIVMIFIICAIIIVANNRNKKGFEQNLNTRPIINYEQKEQQTLEKIKQIDPLFNREEFIASAKTLFVKLQQAWTDRDWSVIRVFETNELYEQHKSQLQGYIDNNQINVMDRICVNYAQLFDFKQEGDKDILIIRLNSRMADYIIDATTQKVLKGDKNTEYVNTYLLTFIRKKGIQTKEGSSKINTTNCPNCGAPTQITSAGECEYCGSVITTGEYNWVLSNLERERK